MTDRTNVKVTVFTPTYNRERYIGRLYASLREQTCPDFEWLVVDQGEDGTEALVKGFRDEAPFPVIYHRLTGERGIGRAMNAMMDIARGTLVMKVDDDDILTPDAISTVLEMEGTLREKECYAGVSGLRMYPDGKAIGGEWPHEADWIDCTNLERDRYGLERDKAEAYYLEVFRAFGPIRTVPGEYYTWEGQLYDRIAHAGKLIRWFNRKIYITEYLPGGATDTGEAAKLSNLHTYTLLISERMTYRELPFLARFKTCCRYFELVRRKGWRFSAVKDAFKKSLPLAYMAYLASSLTRLIARDDAPPVDIKGKTG